MIKVTNVKNNLQKTENPRNMWKFKHLKISLWIEHQKEHIKQEQAHAKNKKKEFWNILEIHIIF